MQPAAATPSAEPATDTPPERRTAVDSDGFVFDLETGEVLGHQEERDFRIASPDAADWALGLMFHEEARVASIEARRAAMLANFDAMLVDPRNRLQWLHRRFDGELIDQAVRDIEAGGGRGKTARYPHGKVACRATPGSSEILDAALALEYVEEWAPQLVKKSVTITGVQEAIAAEAEAIADPDMHTDTRRFFRHGTPSEKWTISTGIGKDSRR